MDRLDLVPAWERLLAWAQAAPEAWVAVGAGSLLAVALGLGLFRSRRRRARARVSAAAAPTPEPAAASREAGRIGPPEEGIAVRPSEPSLAPEEAPTVEVGAAPLQEPVAPIAPATPPTAPPPALPTPPATPPAAPLAPRLAERLSRTREALVGRLGRLFAGRAVDTQLLEELEELLFGADLGVKTAESLLERVRTHAGGDAGSLRRVLREAILEKLRRVEATARDEAATPYVILVLGVNGSGKTTTIGKLAARHAAAGRRVVLGAGDTFRAAAIEQLEVWGRRVGCEVVRGQPGGDPAAVAFDTVRAARSRHADVAIIDTAGRLQTKAPLVEELRKIVRVIARECPGAPHETLLVLDANTGQNAISQARVFTEAAGVTGLVLTKLDGTAKGGVLVGLADEFGIPVRYVGVGEGVEDLREFRAEEFVDALFAEPEAV